MSAPWRPRPHDHLVEPLFGGLGHEAPQEAPAPDRRVRTVLSWVAVLAVAVASLLAVLLTR